MGRGFCSPSLLDRDYEPLLSYLKDWLKPGAEVTLEANPEHITREKLKIWAGLGVNRLSLGVQTFQSKGLRFLTREHSPAEAEAAIRLALDYIPNLNIDLIYGWEGQDQEAWQNDLDRAMASGLKHLSLYTLTYEGHTPLARRQRRGILEALPDDSLEAMYQTACQSLAGAGWDHEEVSNWHKPGFASIHNSIYWQGESYIGLGHGAHSFLADFGGTWGTRWAQDAKIKSFYKGLELLDAGLDLVELLALPGVHCEEGRGPTEWILEVLGTGLRTAQGININALCAKTGYSFQPRPALLAALNHGLMSLNQDGVLKLQPAEWYRETGWALE
ncbi:MAG: coproporphyrinogen-III oxidase family protein, partial [Proteobacteria bacterium]|nr:coproporphyrinogen-III oxidase family protein [Pseudomonadota bacterium]